MKAEHATSGEPLLGGRNKLDQFSEELCNHKPWPDYGGLALPENSSWSCSRQAMWRGGTSRNEQQRQQLVEAHGQEGDIETKRSTVRIVEGAVEDQSVGIVRSCDQMAKPGGGWMANAGWQS